MSDWSTVPGIAILPDWRESYTVTPEYRTSIYEATSGDEQRKALRQQPRRSVEYKGTMVGDNLRKFTGLLNSRRDNRIIIPEITRSEPVDAASLDAGLSAVPVEDMPYWARTGAQVFIYDRSHVGEYRTVASAHEGVLAFTAPLNEAYSGRIRIAPGLRARFQKVEKLTYETSRVATASFDFAVEPGSDYQLLPWDAAHTPINLFHGVESFFFAPNWSTKPVMNFTIPNDAVDYSSGVIDTYFTEAFNNQLLEATFTRATREQARAIEDFFHRAKGRRGAFYVPSFVEDFYYVAVDTARNSIVLNGPVDAALLDDPVNRALVFKRDGTCEPAGIADLFEIDGATHIELDRPISDVVPRSAGPASLLRMSRFASDSLSVEWLTDSVAQIKINFQSVRDSFFEITLNGHRLTIGGDYITIPEEGSTFVPHEPGDYFTINGEHILINAEYPG